MTPTPAPPDSFGLTVEQAAECLQKCTPQQKAVLLNLRARLRQAAAALKAQQEAIHDDSQPVTPAS